jgi:hypothetical protein
MTDQAREVIDCMRRIAHVRPPDAFARTLAAEVERLDAENQQLRAQLAPAVLTITIITP